MASNFRDYVEGSSLFDFDSATGQIIPDTSNVLESVKEMLVDIFDGVLDVSDETPAGRLAELIAVAIKRFASVTASYANQINPNYATGQMLDSVGSIFSVERNGATPTVISVTLSGTPGTQIPTGSKISDNAGHVFSIKDFGTNNTIPAGGTVSATAVCTENGPLELTNGTVTNIVDSTTGWSAVTNTGINTAGTEIESDESLRNRIKSSRWTGTAFTEAIASEVNRCSGVESSFVVDNGYSDDKYLAYYNGKLTLLASPPASGSYIKILKNSVCVIVSGSAIDYSGVGRAVYDTKSVGCGYTALDSDVQGTSKGYKIVTTVEDTYSGIVYDVIYNLPQIVYFNVSATVKRGGYAGTTEEIQQEVKNAVMAWARGEVSSVDGIGLGTSVYATEIASAISVQIPSIKVAGLTIANRSSPSQALSEIAIFVNQIAETDPANIFVTVS